MDNARLNGKHQSFINKANGFNVKTNNTLAPKNSDKHFMCTVWKAMELIRNVGHVGWARHRMWLGQLGQATEFRMSYTIEPH